MREHHAFGESGRAAGVNNGGQGVGGAAHIFHGQCGNSFFFQGQVTIRGLSFPDVNTLPKGRECIGHGLRRGHQAIVHRQRAGTAVAQGVGHFGRCPTCVDRVDHQPGPSPGQQQLDHAVAVQRQHGQALAGLQAQRTQGRRGAGHPVHQLPIGLAAVACDGGNFVGVPLHRAVQTSGEVHACVSIGAA